MDLTAASTKLYEDIFEKCATRQTGTIFVASDENRSGQVVIHQGQLIGISYGGQFNQAALDLLNQLQNLRHSFSADLIFPIAETLLPEHAAELLDSMGFIGYQTEPEPAATPSMPAPARNTDKPAGTVRIYRGQVIG